MTCVFGGAGSAEDLELFRRDCCTFSDADDVPVGPDGSTDLRQLCAKTSGAGRASPLRVGGGGFWMLLAAAWGSAAALQ